jgi:glycine betaine/proline transport system substrate-binding protein
MKPTLRLGHIALSFREASAAGLSVVIPLWHPQWLHYRYCIREPQEPLRLLGGKDTAPLIIRRYAVRKLSPRLFVTLRRMSLGNTVLTALDHAVSAMPSWRRS